MRILHICFILYMTCLARPGLSQFYQVFGPLDVDICSAELNIYSIQTSEELTTTTWVTIPGTSAIDPDVYNATVEFFSPGTYTLIATSVTVDQQFLVDSITIFVYGNSLRPEVIGCYEYSSDSTAGCYNVCAFSQTIIQYPGDNVNFEVTGAESYILLNQSSIQITWGAGGDATVTVYSQGCDQTICFTILPEPVADFSTTPLAVADTLTVCKNQEVYFENLSINGLTYTWYFGDGEQTDGYDASHTYSTEGFYTVTLQANSICDCSDQKQLVIEVLPVPAPTLDCVNSVCPETRQRYSVTPADCAQYTWSISSNGTIVNGGELTDNFIEVIWHEGPDGIIQLSVNGCATQYCSFTNTFRVPIITPEGPLEGDASVCSGEISSYTAPYFPGTQYQWTLGGFGTILGGQGTNGITVKWNTVNSPTATNVAVVYDNCFLGCGGGDVMQVNITPEIRLVGDVQVCQNLNASIMAEAGFNVFSPVNVSWHIEDANGQIVYTAPGTSSVFNHVFTYPPGEYAWVATNSSGSYCTEEIRQTIVVTELPDAPLGISGPDKICPGQLYGFTIESAGDYGTTWFITDGTFLTTYDGQTIQHAFGPVPPYTILAYHTDIQYMNCGSDPVSITLGTAADLTITGPDDVCLNGIDSYSTDYISGVDYTWEIIPADHGEIRRSDLNTVEVFWSRTGNATLRLNACGVSIDKPVLVRSLPAFNLVGPTAACANELVVVSTNQPLLSHEWVDDNDNIISTLNSVQLPPGSFGIALTDGFGCTNEKSFQINTYPAPLVHLSTAYASAYCATIPGGVEIVANTDGTDYAYTWFLDDVVIGPGGPTFNVNNFGAHHVEVSNQYGCRTASEKIIFLDCCPPSSCGFNIPGSFPGCTFLFNDFSISATESECHIHQFSPLVAGLTPGSVSWYIESASEGLIATVDADILNYTYQKPGYYRITMAGELNGYPYDMVTCGHYQDLVDTVRAVADFKFEGICTSSPILFEDLTTFLPDESISAWSWDFGDPASGADNTSATQNPIHVFDNAGIYEVALTVTMASGCLTTKKIQVTITDGPALMPAFDPIHCEDEAMAFQLPGQIYDIQWVFGDPASGVENMAISDSVFHTFALPGAYWVTVGASDVNGCMSGVTFMVDIQANTLSGLINVDPIIPLCHGDTAILSPPPGGQSWSWSTGETGPQIEVTESNQYNVLIRDQYNCTYTPPSVFVEVFPKPEVIIRAREIYGPDEFGPWSASLEICVGSEFEISAFSTGNVSYHWTNGELTQVLQFTSEGSNLPGPGEYTYIVNTIDLMNGCISDSSSIHIEIFELPQIPVIALVSGSGCSFNPNVLQVTNPEAGVTYTWSDGQEGVSITTEVAGAYQVTAINQNGCAAMSNIVVINPSAPVDQIPGGCFIKCDPLTVCLPPLTGVSSYTIYQNGNVYLSGTTWPADYLITDDGSYTIEITSSNGCVATSDPLDVMLYTGVGSITVETWLDQDGDGMVSGGDVLLPGISVQIISDDGLHSGKTETVPDGQFVFEDYPATSYLAHFDLALLPSQYMVLIDSLNAVIATCDDSVVVSLLLTENCTVTGPDQSFELCPGELLTLGDSTWTDTGTYEMHMSSVGGCDSVFNVMITLPDSLAFNVVVWVDVDHNGIVSPADTVIQGITIAFDRQISVSPYTGVTDINGVVQGYYPLTDYYVYIDSTILPPGLMVVYGLAFVADTSCGTVHLDFLLESICPSVFFIQQETLCPGDSIWVEGQWLHDAGQYTFIHSDPMTMCDTVIDVYITVTEALVWQAVTDWNCETLGSIDLEISGAGPFTINWGQGFPGDTLITGLDEGDYTVQITDANGCAVYDTLSIVASPLLQFNIPALFKVQEGDSVLISITGDISVPGLVFEWTPADILSCSSCPATFAHPIQDTIITIEITDSNNCVYLLQTMVMLTADSSSLDQIYVPNVFSPNGDGLNDYWTIFSKLDNTYIHDMAVYDRWGTLVYSQKESYLNAFDGWDGRFNGTAMNPGVFVYFANVVLGDGREVVVKGDVTLVR